MRLGSQSSGPDQVGIMMVLLIIGLIIATGSVVMQQVGGYDYQKQVCTNEYGPEAEPVNSTDVLDCRLPNGTIIEPSINLSGSQTVIT